MNTVNINDINNDHGSKVPPTDAAADWDVVIVGRSFAGLSAALTLGRMRRSVLVIGTGGPRNEAVAHVHGMLTRDGADPNELIAIAETELAHYPSIELVDAHVTSIRPDHDLFRVTFDRGTSTASKVILATGVNDNPPPIPGLTEYWGRGVFTCPFCDGYEHRDLTVAVVGDPTITPHVARLLSFLTDHVILHADPNPETRLHLATAGIHVDNREVTRVVGDGTHVTGIELADGSHTAVGAVFVAGMPHPNNQLAEALGCTLDPTGLVNVDTAFQTNIDGVWAIGDLATRHHQIPIAIAHAATAGANCFLALVLT